MVFREVYVNNEILTIHSVYSLQCILAINDDIFVYEENLDVY